VPPPESLLRRYDLITTSFPHFVERFRAQGIDTEYLPIAFDERVLDRLRTSGIEPAPGAERPHLLSFIGGLSPAVYGRGTVLFERLANAIPFDVWGYDVDGLPPESPLRRRYKGEAWGLDMYEVLAQSRITLNRHGEIAEGYANNMRLFEATGVGALLLTEAAPNLSQLFELGREIVAYDSADDLIEKVRHYLGHDAERQAIAAAGQRRTLADHTYQRRLARLVEILEPRLR
jgi:hypothetical protein